MAERNGYRIIYTADDEMPDCLNCDRCDSKYDCSRYCGAPRGWNGYRRTEYFTDKEIEAVANYFKENCDGK